MTDRKTDRERRSDTAGDTPPLPAPSIVEIQNVSKRFGGIYANRDISLTVKQGEIHAVAGENGAGKSTLMHMIFGRLSPDSGSILLRGRPVSFRTPRDAIRAGIGMVHQNILSFPQLSVLENVVAGSERSRAGLLQSVAAREELLRLQNVFGFHLDPDLPARELPFAQRQQIELLKALYRGAELLIFDEPTSLLAPGETERLLGLLESLRENGRTIFFISHRLSEVFRIADRVTVLRRGSVEATLDIAATNPGEIARLMVGGRPEYLAERGEPGTGTAERPPGAEAAPLLELRNVSIRARGTEPAIGNISIAVDRGEIFGIAGIVGNGQRLLARALAGRIAPAEGVIRFDGADITTMGIGARIREGILWLPENINEEALLPEHTIWENFLLGRQREEEFSRKKVLRKSAILRFAAEQMLENTIAAPDPCLPVASLSGGNRQKVALGRLLARPPRLAIIEQPTRGLDLHASERLRQRLAGLRHTQRMTIVVLSYDLDELISLCDRIAVLYRGAVMGTAVRGGFSFELLGGWMAGMTEPKEEKVH